MPCPAVRPFWSIQSNHILDRRGCTTYALCTGEFEKELEQAIGLLLDLCKAHLMMTPSLSRCKTELMMLSFNGKGSRAYRIKYYEPHSLGFFPVLCEPDVKQLLLVKSYKHLGGMLHHADQCQEVRQKIASAHAAFNQHRTIRTIRTIRAGVKNDLVGGLEHDFYFPNIWDNHG